jgi:hypothetical protein
MNYAVLFVALGLAWALVIAAMMVRPAVLKVVVVAVASLWAVLCSFIGLGAGLNLIDIVLKGTDASFEKIDSKDVHGHTVSVYRTNAGAMSDYGIVVRHERPILAGLILARPIYSVSPGYEARITVLSAGRLRIESPPYGEKRAKADVRVIQLGDSSLP